MDKPYVIFKMDFYYPSGGWGDYASRYATFEEALAVVKGLGLNEKSQSFVQIVNVLTGEILHE